MIIIQMMIGQTMVLLLITKTLVKHTVLEVVNQNVKAVETLEEILEEMMEEKS